MSKSAQLRSRDVRALYVLAGECRDLGDDPSTWWAHYGSRLAGLTGANFAGCGQVRYDSAGRAETLGIGEWGWDHGFDPEPWRESVAAFDANPQYSTLYRRYFRRWADDDGICLARSDLMTDTDWVRTWNFREVAEPMGVDHYLWCYHSLPADPKQHGVAVLARSIGRRDFSTREKAVVRAAHSLVAPLVGGPLARFAEPSPADLPPRVREVLRCLLEGDGDKQVAARLGISRFTVNVHTKAIFRHFGAQSRAELLARWVRRGWGGRCAWAGDGQ